MTRTPSRIAGLGTEHYLVLLARSARTSPYWVLMWPIVPLAESLPICMPTMRAGGISQIAIAHRAYRLMELQKPFDVAKIKEPLSRKGA